jgi:branched-subunit amino acid transport protein
MDLENEATGRAGAATGPYVFSATPSSGAGRAPLMLAARAVASGNELEVLLRQRLKALAWIGLGIVGPLTVYMLPDLLRSGYWHMLAILGALIATAGLGVMLTWLGRPRTLGGLRLLEALDVLVVVTCITLWTHDHASWRTAAIMSELSNQPFQVTFDAAARETGRDRPNTLVFDLGDIPIQCLAAFLNIFWGALIMGYGMMFPNTWRRCVTVVGAIALTAITVQWLFIASDVDVRPSARAMYMLNTVVCVAFGSALAVFGSHRIESLRQEAAAARRLGQYQLKELIGSGGMGEVYLAEHALLRRPCAIKIIRPERAGDARNLARFEREVQATATLTNWHTVEIFDYGRAHDGTFYYVMEYLPGLNLEQLVQEHGPLPPERAVHFLCQLCAALHEAHAIGLIHRDIKPGNVLACERGGVADVAKLLDFGLVAAHRSTPDDAKLTQEGALAGTPAYMSPEQAAGLADVDATSDIYSLGALAYFLLTGRPPFVRQTSVQVLAAHLHETPAPLQDSRGDVPEALQKVVLRCLEKEKSRRFSDVDTLEQALRACRGSEPWTDARARAWWEGLAKR